MLSYHISKFHKAERDAKLPHFQIPQSGSLIVWGNKSGVLVKMLVPDNALRTACLVNRKCRAEFVRVIKVYNDKGKTHSMNPVTGLRPVDRKTVYEEGKITYPDKYCNDFKNDCSHGIHFFLTKKEAEEWKVW